MKSFLSIVVMFTLLIQCKAVKSTEHINTKVEHKDNKETGAQHDGDALRQDTLFLYCDDFTGYYDKAKRYLYKKGSLVYCLREKAYLGDTASIRQIAALIPLMRNPFGTFNQKLRGEILFKAVLDRLHNFEFVTGPNGELEFNNYYGRYGRVMSEMIESIDGMSQYDYLNKHIYTKERTELESEELFSPKYIQILARLSWETYKEAYDKGLIKLKAFGQE